MRRSILVLVIGGLIGLSIGFYLGWVQFPVQTINAPLSLLSPASKANYVLMVAEGYQVTGDLTEATRQIDQLGVPDAGIYVRQITEALITTAGPTDASHIRAMAKLAVAFGQGSPLMQPYIIATASPLTIATP